MHYDDLTRTSFHKAGKANNVEPALAAQADFMRQHVEKMYNDNRNNPAISDLNLCFETMRNPDILKETALIIWNIWNRSQQGHGEPVLWDCGKVVLSIACCAFVDPVNIKKVYPETYENWLNDLITNLLPEKAVVDVMFGLEGDRMAVHMSFIAPQEFGSTNRGFCILATDLAGDDLSQFVFSNKQNKSARRPWWRFWR